MPSNVPLKKKGSSHYIPVINSGWHCLIFSLQCPWLSCSLCLESCFSFLCLDHLNLVFEVQSMYPFIMGHVPNILHPHTLWSHFTCLPKLLRRAAITHLGLFAHFFAMMKSLKTERYLCVGFPSAAPASGMTVAHRGLSVHEGTNGCLNATKRLQRAI